MAALRLCWRCAAPHTRSIPKSKCAPGESVGLGLFTACQTAPLASCAGLQAAPAFAAAPGGPAPAALPLSPLHSSPGRWWSPGGCMHRQRAAAPKEEGSRRRAGAVRDYQLEKQKDACGRLAQDAHTSLHARTHAFTARTHSTHACTHACVAKFACSQTFPSSVANFLL